MLPKEVEDVLTLHGFHPNGEEYLGVREIQPHGTFSFRITFRHFPEALPEIFVNPEALPRLVAHIDSRGKICIAPTSGVLLDIANPGGIVRDAIRRAESILKRGLDGSSDVDFADEFLSYWYDGTPATRILSTIESDSTARVCKYCRLKPALGGIPHNANALLSDSREKAEAWISKLGRQLVSVDDAFYLPLDSPIPPPPFSEIDAQSLLNNIEQHVSATALDAFRKWLRKVVLPIIVVVSFPTSNGRTLFGFKIGSRDIEIGGRHSFRKGQFRASARIENETLADKLRLERFDLPFLLKRAGARWNLRDRSVVLVGCGSVGSFIGVFLAMAGVGNVRFVDNDVLTNENVHRHYFGVPQIGLNKAQGLAQHLSRQYPHLSFQSSSDSVMAVLENDPAFFEVDGIIFATGEETLELWANRKFHDSRMTVHCWNEPFGVGGHSLVSLKKARGCLQCLYKRSESGEIYNAAAFAAADQNFIQSIAGCGGGFFPFSFLDSIRTASLATESACCGLSNELASSELMSWFGDVDSFVRAGYKLSPRASLFSPRSQHLEREFMDPACDVCGSPR